MIYLLTFPDLGNERHRARYYIGFCADDREPAERLAEHRAGRGAAITRAVVERYGPDALTMVWCVKGDRSLERRLKRQRNHRRFVNPQRVQRFSESQKAPAQSARPKSKSATARATHARAVANTIRREVTYHVC